MLKLRKVIAILTVFVVIGFIIGTLICAITGSSYFFGMLFLSFVVPVVLWVFMWFTNLINGNKTNEQESATEQEEK